MRLISSISSLALLLAASIVTAYPAITPHPSRNVSIQLFAELEELARIVDISYCVGLTGIRAPFSCASRCSDFESYELVDTWNTGPLMSDSCGYIVLDHNAPGRILLAFRGTYSIANTIVDLSTIPQEYVPYPGDPEGGHDDGHKHSYLDLFPRPLRWLYESRTKHTARISEDQKIDGQRRPEKKPKGPKCNNCTVHSGFLTSWQNTRPLILPHVTRLKELYPTYSLHLVGHSLGGAVAALAGLEFDILGYDPTITTFGEPKIGNMGLRQYLDGIFGLEGDGDLSDVRQGGRYRRVTHVDDPVPLLPLSEWGYLMHAGEIYISKPSLQPGVTDLELCDGDEDPKCIAGSETTPPISSASPFNVSPAELSKAAFELDMRSMEEKMIGREGSMMKDGKLSEAKWGLPARYKMWQLFFAHRDYFWRLGLCAPGGDPWDWGRPGYGPDDNTVGGGKEEL